MLTPVWEIAMDRTMQLIAPARDYENRTPTFRFSGGEFRIGLDGQIVCMESHRTLANSNGAHLWITEHAVKADVPSALRATRPPDTKPISPIEDIAVRKNIHPSKQGSLKWPLSSVDE